MNRSYTHNEDRYGKFLFAGITAILFVYVTYRAFHLSITNDEAFTFYNVATHHIKMMCGTANTHWLNSFFVWIESILIGNKEWMIRIHSLLSFILFSWAIYRFCLHFISTFWQWMIPISLLLLNIYILDFFSLARGYSLGMAFEVLAFSYILNSDKSPRNLFFSYLFLSVATISCYTCILILFSFLIHEVFSKIRQAGFRELFSKKWLLAHLPVLITFLVAIPNILFIRHEGDLEEGQRNGLVQDSFGVFFERSYPALFSKEILYLFIGIVLILLFLFFLFLRRSIDRNMWILFELFVIHIVVVEALFFIFKIPYIFGRTSLSFNILFLLLLVYALAFIINRWPYRYALIICLLLCTGSSYNFIEMKEHRSTIEWYKTQGIERCISELESLAKGPVQGKKLGLHLSQLGSYTNYYQYLNRYPINDTVYSFCENESGIFEPATIDQMLQQDFLLLLRPYNQYFNKNQYFFLKHYEDMNADLVEVRK
ncbi:MAG: hypothetical protein IPJ31_04530 [Bacteroidetes bacterium]|nr:hypothetical protein [Bacteroidota bacterium]